MVIYFVDSPSYRAMQVEPALVDLGVMSNPAL